MRESDTLIDQTTLEAKIRRGIEEYEQGKVHKMEEGESVDGFLVEWLMKTEMYIYDEVIEVLVLSAFGHYKK